MASYDLVMPKMGESIIEATILNWVKEVGDTVEVDETILEIATDKVDSEVPSPVEGKISKILFQVDDVVPVGETIAIIETDAAQAADEGSSDAGSSEVESSPSVKKEEESAQPAPAATSAERPESQKGGADEESMRPGQSDRFYSPLVRKIAATEGIPKSELDTVSGTGRDGRVTKHDILSYLEHRDSSAAAPEKPAAASSPSQTSSAPASEPQAPAIPVGEDDEVIEMDRMRKMIAEHMVRSKRTSPHVTSNVEVDVSNLFQWRSKNKKAFEEKYGTKITFTPIFFEAVCKALRDFPGVNVSVDGTNIIRRKHINIGMATALPSGNLIVPVIKDADHLSLVGLAKNVNDLANRARNNNLKPDELQGGTFTVTNVGTFGNVMGTPIIFQPQVAILATGAIRKKPAVLETEHGDVIAIRQMMYLSLSYDHRVVDGALGGTFLREIGRNLEAFDPNREI
ncbi:MAG: 2-oxo acid dehydrogenase subunit E2 [Bacteroidetes bacterium]|jgi:2-oxoglutarate dehydrogenase E2 component (dihydrolipoamide succinyltransferase)|nr:2-oxo acid dehydrogenase subunit E2 [Bacteroidota bacterium]